MSRWVKDTVALVDWVTKDQAHSKVILIGAGVGGWVMFHAARERPNLIQGLVSFVLTCLLFSCLLFGRSLSFRVKST